MTKEHWNMLRSTEDKEVQLQWANFWKGVVPGANKTEERARDKYLLMSSNSLIVLQM